MLARYPDLYTEWSVNEKVSLEVALGASMMGARALCAMKHVGLNVASDALMTLTVTGVEGGLVIVVADDVGMSSSQNEQDSRFWGRFAHLPVLEPADSQEAYALTRAAFAISEQFRSAVIVRLTTRICHVKGLVTPGERELVEPRGFDKDPARWVMVPGHAKPRLPLMFEREAALREAAEASMFNVLEGAPTPSWVSSPRGRPACMCSKPFRMRRCCASVFSYPPPLERIRALASSVKRLVVVEETEPLLETELKAAGIACHGKDILPRLGELAPDVLKPAIERWRRGEPLPRAEPAAPQTVFPRPPTLCVACPHLGVYYTLSQLRNVLISGDIGCYTLGAGHPGTRSTPASRWAPRWAWRWAWTRAAARKTPTRRSSR